MTPLHITSLRASSAEPSNDRRRLSPSTLSLDLNRREEKKENKRELREMKKRPRKEMRKKLKQRSKTRVNQQEK
jgi:hypothetical protein